MNRLPILSYMRPESSLRKTHSVLGYLSLIGPSCQSTWMLIGFHTPQPLAPLAIVALLSPGIAIAAIFNDIAHHPRALFIPVLCLCVYPLFILRLCYLLANY
jgi:hypothetical protein